MFGNLVNIHSSYQLSSRVAMSQLKEPRVDPSYFLPASSSRSTGEQILLLVAVLVLTKLQKLQN